MASPRAINPVHLLGHSVSQLGGQAQHEELEIKRGDAIVIVGVVASNPTPDILRDFAFCYPTRQHLLRMRDRFLPQQFSSVGSLRQFCKIANDKAENEAADHHCDDAGNGLQACLWHDVTVADCRHRHRCPVERCDILLPSARIGWAFNRRELAGDPALLLITLSIVAIGRCIRLHGAKSEEQAAQPVTNNDDDYDELAQLERLHSS